MNKDKLHYSPRKLDSYNRTFNFVISEREAGKTTALLATKIYKMWKHHNRPSIILRRQQVDITDVYITDLQDTINDFLPEKQKIKFEFKKGAIKDGVVDVTVNGKPFCRFMALSVPKSRIKSLRYDDPYAIFFDEFIVDNRGGEKYLLDEANKFKELYNTFLRFATKHGHRLKAFFCGNPYSTFNPFFVWLNVDLSKIHPGAFIVGDEFVIECYQLKPELREFILKNNALYHFDDSYVRYSFGGQAINDDNFNVIAKQPEGYKLKYIFRMQNKYLYIYHQSLNRDYKDATDYGKYWIASRNSYDGSKNVVSIDFNNLVEGTQLITSDIRLITYRLKNCIGNRDVSYNSIEAGYLTETLYKSI